MAEKEPRFDIPAICTKPYLPGHMVFYNSTTAKAVSATSATGGYPQVGTTAPGPQSYDKIRNTLILQTIVLGKLDGAQILAAIGQPDQPDRQYRKLATTLKNQFCSLDKQGAKYEAIYSEWSIHDALVDIRNLGVDISIALARGDAQAQELQEELRDYQLQICKRIDDIIKELEAEREFPKAKPSRSKEAEGLTYGQYVALERQRLQELKKRFESPPASLLKDPTQAAVTSLEKKSYYLQKTKKERLHIWKQPDFFKSFIILFLSIAIGPMEIATSIQDPHYHEYISNQLANFCDAAVELMIGPEDAKWQAVHAATTEIGVNMASRMSEGDLKAFKARHYGFHEQWNRAGEQSGHPEKKVTGIDVVRVSPLVRGFNRMREKNRDMRGALMAQSVGPSDPGERDEDDFDLGD